MRIRRTRKTILVLLVSSLMAWASGTDAQATALDVSDLCDRAALAASRSEEVPLDILRAVTRTETGRSLNGVLAPWPWASNAGGDGAWFDTREEALRHVETILASGRQNVDIGCFQLNHRWHANAFPTLRDMIDPEANARYAAQFLRRLHGELGDWSAAVAAYHSRNPVYAARYMARFRTILDNLPDSSTADTHPARERVNGPSPLDFAARPSLLTRADGLSSQGAAPLLSGRPAQSLFGDLP